MKWVRRHRQRFILVFSLGAIGAMTYGYLKRIGMDPLSGLGQGPGTAPAQTGGDCEPHPYDGPCELVSATGINLDGRRALRAEYRLQDVPRRVVVERVVTGEAGREITAEPVMMCRGVWMGGPCANEVFSFSTPPESEPASR